MTHLMELTGGRRVRLEELDLDTGLPIACVIAGDQIVQLSPPCAGTNHLAFLFLNGLEQYRFIFIGQSDDDDEWLADDGRIFTSHEIADLPLQVAAQITDLTPEIMKGFDS